MGIVNVLGIFILMNVCHVINRRAKLLLFHRDVVKHPAVLIEQI